MRKLVAFTIVRLVSSACASGGGTNRSNPLTIQEQGSFLVGGIVVTITGTFDQIKQGAYNPTTDPTGQTVHGDHAYVFYQVPVNRARCHL